MMCDVIMCYMVAKMEVYQECLYAGLIIPRSVRPSTKFCESELV